MKISQNKIVYPAKFTCGENEHFECSNLSPDTLDKNLKTKKEIKMRIPENNWNNFPLLDLQKKPFKTPKKFVKWFLTVQMDHGKRPFYMKEKLQSWFIQSGIKWDMLSF